MFQRIVGLLVLAPNSIPAPLVADKEVAFLANLMVVSSTSRFAVFMVVVVPFTVKSPVTVRSFVTVRSLPIVTSSGRPIVTEAVSLPEPETSTSLDVPVIVAT